MYLETLSDLQDRLPSFPNEIAEGVLVDELGGGMGTLFAEISEDPMAAASLGQVTAWPLLTHKTLTEPYFLGGGALQPLSNLEASRARPDKERTSSGKSHPLSGEKKYLKSKTTSNSKKTTIIGLHFT